MFSAIDNYTYIISAEVRIYILQTKGEDPRSWKSFARRNFKVWSRAGETELC